MSQAFQTLEGSPDVEIIGVGVCPADGQGGVLLDHAAELMHELQNDAGKPLTGTALAKAAKTWADQAGLTVGTTTIAAAEAAEVTTQAAQAGEE